MPKYTPEQDEWDMMTDEDLCNILEDEDVVLYDWSYSLLLQDALAKCLMQEMFERIESRLILDYNWQQEALDK